jgi:hypothetical protein
MLDNSHAMKTNGEHQRRVVVVMLNVAIAVVNGQSDVEFFNAIIDNSHVLGVTRKRCNQLRVRRVGGKTHSLHKHPN